MITSLMKMSIKSIEDYTIFTINSSEDYIDLYKLNDYKNLIWIGSNYLTNLEDEETEKVLIENLNKYCKKQFKTKCFIIYHKIKSYSSKTPRDREDYEGFFSICNVLNGKRLSTKTTFKGLVEELRTKKLSVDMILISNNYNLITEGGSQE